MSRINDALKRAREAQRPDPQSRVMPMRPVETKNRESHIGRWLLGVIIFLLVAAGFFIGLAVFQRPVEKNVPAPQTATAQPVVAAALPVRPQPLAPTVAPVVAVAPATPPPVAAKALRVQGIFADPVRPWAIVNGQTVYIGSVVGQMRVTEIANNAVTLVGQGVTNRLVLGQ